MGLLKLGSIYRKKNKKVADTSTPPPSLPDKLVPLSLELNFNLDGSSSFDTTKHQSTATTMIDKSESAPIVSGSLFEDIFSELGTKPAKHEKGL